MAAGKGGTMIKTIAFLLVLPITGIAGADTLILPENRSVEKSEEKDFFLFPRDGKVKIYGLDDSRLLLEKLRPVVLDSYPQQIINIDSKNDPRHRQKYRPHRGYTD